MPDEAALKVEPGDPEGLAQALARMIGDRDLRRRCAAASLAAGRSLPRWTDTAAAVARALRAVTGAFTADWLALREPADHAALDRGLLATLSQTFADRESITIVDLGCGTGSNLRALAAHLPARQHWRLVDADATLLARARHSLSDWADAATDDGGVLELRRGDRSIRVAFVEADLARDLDAILAPLPDLVTAAALFDLVSAAFVDRLTGIVAGSAAFYATLTYDGRTTWSPPDPADAAVHAAFLAHQRSDKGFGPSLGPDAPAALAATFAARGTTVTTGDSPWRLDPAQAALVRDLADGIAAAAAQTGLVPAAGIEAWLAARRTGASCLIGHRDVLALPAAASCARSRPGERGGGAGRPPREPPRARPG